MVAERIRINPFFMEQVLACEIKKEPNEHGQAYVKGYIPASQEENYLSLGARDTGVQIEAVRQEGESRIIFSGIVKQCEIRHSNQLLVMELRLISYTYLMDLQPRIRSFQIPSLPYQQIFDTVVGTYPQGGCILTEEDKAVSEELVVQYQETDWTFLKRLASHLQLPVVGEVQTQGVKVYIGLPKRGKKMKISPVSYTACKASQDYLYKQQNQVEGLLEEDELYYEVQEQEVLELGDQVEFLHQTYCVAGVKSYLDGHQLWNSYRIKPEAGLRVPKQYNEKMIGASLDGSVTKIQGAQVKIRLGADGIRGEERWFPFSTIYSSADGSGWYCMPEPGDEIRLYFPTIKEKHAYVISAVHLPVSGEASFSQEWMAPGACDGGMAAAVGGGSKTALPASAASGGSASTAGNGAAPRSNPDCKTISTVTGKTVELTPTRIYLSNKKGLEIILDDQEGILMISNQKINIRSQDTINITSEAGVELIGQKKIHLQQKKASVTLKESRIELLGADVRMQ